MRDSPRLGTSFSGIEGFGLGFELAGWRLQWTGEIDAHASKVLKHHYPGVENTGDITGLAPERLGDVDCYAFGFPCQDLSVAGHRAGLGGDRSGLFWEAVRVLASKRPKWFVAENVPGLLSSNHGQDFGVVLWALAAIGYGVTYAELDAKYFGVPQRRRRLFLVGCLGDAESARAVLSDAPGGYWDTAPSQESRHPVAAGVGKCLTGSGNRQDPTVETLVFDTLQDPVSGGIAGALTGQGRQGVTITDPRGHPAGPTHLQPGTTERGDADHWSGQGGDVAETLTGSRKGIGERVWPTTASIDASRDRTPTGLPGWMDLPMWRDHEGARALCLDAEATPAHHGEEGREKHDDALRGSVERGRRELAGGPMETKSHAHDESISGPSGACRCPDTPRYRETGNAVPVPVAYWIARRILLVEEGVLT